MRRADVGDWLVSLGHDLRFASRQFRRSPGFVAAVVLTLALGIGATTAIFTVVNGVLLRPLPYPTPERIVQLWQVDAAANRSQFSDPNFDDIREGARSFVGLAEFTNGGPTSVAGSIAPTRAAIALVSHDFFDVLGVRPALGRTLLPDEERENGTPAAVISWGFWQRAFGASHEALGQRLVVGDRTYTVVGVMNPALDFPAGTDFWTSRELTGRLPSRTAHNWQVIGRLRPGVSLDQARHDVGALAQTLAARYGSETLMAGATIVPLREQLVGATRPVLLVLLGASAVLMLIACANVANLLVARLAVRSDEMALRLALGASRTQVMQQCLAESAILALSGGILGLVIAIVATKALLVFQPGWLARAGDVRLDAPVLLFAFTVSVVTALGLAGVCAWRATRGDQRERLSSAQRTTSGTGASVRLRDALVVAQVAMTLVLLVGTGLFARTFTNLLTVDPGFRTQGSVVVDVAIQAYDEGTRQERTAFYREILARLGAIPGITAGAINVMPLAALGGPSGTFIEMASPDERIVSADFPRLLRDHARTGQAAFRVGSEGYFAAMHIPILEGRVFDDRDGPDAPHVALVSASLAKKRWPNRSPVGNWIQFGTMDGDLRPLMIVGVVGDVREQGLAASAQPTVYANYLQRPVGTTRMNIVLAGAADPSAVAARARATVADLRPDVSPRIRTIDAIVDSSVAGPRFVLLLAGAFGGAAILLAAFGVYSVISYLVAQRTRELSIRVALGAGRGNIVRLVVGHGAALAAAGIVVGAATAMATTRLLAGLLYGISPTDPIAFVGVALVVAAVVLAASWLPARRASRVDVMRGLRGN